MSSTNKALFLFSGVLAFVLGVFFGQRFFYGLDNIQDEVLWRAQLNTEKQHVQSVSQLADELTLVNFWASWCAPCRREMPVFESFYRIHNDKGFTIIGVAIDNIETARPMLDAMDISYPLLYAENTGMEIMAKTGNEQGFLPYTVLYNSHGKIVEAKLGEIDQILLEEWLKKYL